MNRALSSNRAFTLIELLIVVAIIAILAAIAVPNFLEAQTRAKVSRVRADMRSVAVAVESYGIDYNTYPPTGIYSGDTAYTAATVYPRSLRTSIAGITVLTTPVAYITSFPRDPFPAVEHWSGQDPTNSALGRTDRPLFFYNVITYSQRGTRPDGIFVPEFNRGFGWSTHSVGPSGLRWAAWPPSPVVPSYLIPYDPTNGTVSQGGIVRYGPGDNPYYN